MKEQSVGKIKTGDETNCGNEKTDKNNYTSWRKFCENDGIWSVYTVEFIDALEEVIRGLNETPILPPETAFPPPSSKFIPNLSLK